jgi:prepilin-type processing-associated H-X9-DG protein
LTDQKISYFIGLDADSGNSRHVLAGDRNVGLQNSVAEVHGLAMITNEHQVRWTKLLHEGNGNLAYADGSAQQATTRDLQEILKATGFMTNRLVVP